MMIPRISQNISLSSLNSDENQTVHSTSEKSVDLQYQNLEEVPESLRESKNVEEINISCNYIKKLPNWIASLPLKNIDAECNAIEEIDVLADAKQLEFVKLNGNKITFIIESFFANLQNLILLDLDNNKLTSLFGIEKLKNLMHLSAADNQISELPEIDVKTTNLSFFDVSNNPLRSIPQSIQQLQKKEGCTVRFDLTDSGDEELLEDDEEILEKQTTTQKVKEWLTNLEAQEN